MHHLLAAPLALILAALSQAQTHVATVVSDHGANGSITIPAHDAVANGPLQSITCQVSADVVRTFSITNFGPAPAHIVLDGQSGGFASYQAIYVLGPGGSRMGFSAFFGLQPTQVGVPGLTTLPPFSNHFLGLNSQPDTSSMFLPQFEGPPGATVTLPVKFRSQSVTTIDFGGGPCSIDQGSLVTATIQLTYN